MLTLRADPWLPDYGMGYEASLEEAPARAEPFVETEDWSTPRRPTGARTGPVWFVDGVRRIELRLIASDGGRRAFGLFGTYAAGTVRSDGRAEFGEHAVDRAVVLGSGLQPEPVDMMIGGTRVAYAAVSETGMEPDEPLRRLQKLMQRREMELATAVAVQGSEIVFADGRWPYEHPTASPVVGLIKRWSRAYLEPEQDSLIGRLGPGERSPLFGLADPEAPVARYAWYARLVELRGEWHDHAGVVRCEVRAGIGLDEAIVVADRVTALLPAFAGRPSDPRYPQNLAPVGALERRLQHRMGHVGVLRRAITDWLLRREG